MALVRMTGSLFASYVNLVTNQAVLAMPPLYDASIVDPEQVAAGSGAGEWEPGRGTWPLPSICSGCLAHDIMMQSVFIMVWLLPPS